MKLPLVRNTLDSMFEACIKQQLNHEPQRYAEFMHNTMLPGFLAACKAGTVASATSLLVTYLVAYRVDGRNLVSAMGSSFAPAESWLRQTARDHIEANDCDGYCVAARDIFRRFVSFHSGKLLGKVISTISR